MRKYFYIKFYMCSPVVHKHAAGLTVEPLGNACRRPVSYYTYLFDSLSYDDSDSNSLSNGIPATSLMAFDI